MIRGGVSRFGPEYFAIDRFCLIRAAGNLQLHCFTAAIVGRRKQLGL
jgi:hypothetical protein